MEIATQIDAPFTDSQVNAMNAYQRMGVFHPFTCANRDNHPGEGLLIATNDGWVCRYCDYTQNWAWAMMAGDWRQVLCLPLYKHLRNPLCGQPAADDGSPIDDMCMCGCDAYYEFCGDWRCNEFHFSGRYVDSVTNFPEIT